MSEVLPNPSPPAQGDLRGVLAIPAFRRLWRTLALSSLGDWLGLLATTALAKQLAGDNYAKANVAIAGVFILRLLPAVIIGPFAGVIADRFDRRKLMFVCDVIRGGLFISIPIVHQYWWLYTATVLIEAVTLFWSPAKEASVPNIVPRDRLEAANQVSLLATYGSAPIAAVLFSFFALIHSAINVEIGFFSTNAVDISLYFDGFTFFLSGWIILKLQEIPKVKGGTPATESNVMKALIDGWKYVAQTKVIRGLIVGMLGAFAAGGAVVGLARTFVGDLGGGDAAYGVLFGAVFLGLAGGMGLGPRTLRGFSRRRLFGLALTLAGIALIFLALIPNLVMAVFTTIVLGYCAGVSWVSGFTMLGLEVADEVRGRTFAFVQSLIRITLVLVLAVAPAIAAAVGEHWISINKTQVHYNGAEITLFLAGIFATLVGILSYRQMDDRRGVPLIADLVDAFRGDIGVVNLYEKKGLFIAFEGGEGSGKSTQTQALKSWLEAQGRTVVLSREPGGTEIGQKIRKLLLDPATGEVSSRAEALLYAADRAEHVDTVIRPAIDRGAVVITDRYIDSSIAYQGGGRVLPSEDVMRLSRWATSGLLPDMTVVLDIDPRLGLARCKDHDRLEQEPMEFHDRVRRTFVQLARSEPERYLVIDANQSSEEISRIIQNRFAHLLADPKASK